VTERALPPLLVTGYQIPPAAAFSELTAQPLAPVNYAGGLSLVGLGLSETKVAPSQKVDVLLRWQARSPLESDMTLFAHLLDHRQSRLTQHDVLLQNASGLPTSGWTPGEKADARFLLSIPADAPAGDYVLVAGLYDVETGDRLWLENVEGLQNGTVYPLATIHVGAWRSDS
jgi:hypothetical protein